MRVTKLLGILFLVAGVSAFSRGGWHFPPVVLGVVLAFVGLLLVTARPVRRFRVAPPRRTFRLRPGRIRTVPAAGK